MVEALKTPITYIFICPILLVGDVFGKLLSAMIRTEVLRWLSRPRFNGQSFSSSGVSVEKKPFAYYYPSVYGLFYVLHTKMYGFHIGGRKMTL